MVTINTPDDILRLLAENPEWKAAVRREILSEELMNLPARFDRFVADTEEFIEQQREHNASTDQFIEEQRKFNEEQREFNEQQREFNEEQRKFIAEQREHNVSTDRAINRLRDDISTMRETHARDQTLREAQGIVLEMGFRTIRILTYNELLEMHLAADTTGITTADLRSFRRADVVIEAADEAGATHYIAVEVSYTADERDTNRAIRNAAFLTRFTGHPAHPAIASLRNDDRIQDVIDSGQVFWYELEDREPRYDEC